MNAALVLSKVKKKIGKVSINKKLELNLLFINLNTNTDAKIQLVIKRRSLASL